MDAVFLEVVNMSITGSYVILAVLLLRLLLKKAPKKYAYLLWSVVGFRLCCPVTFQSVFSLFSLKPFDMTKAQRSGGETLNYIVPGGSGTAFSQATTGIPSANAVLYDNLPATAATDPKPLVITVLAYVWFAVCIAFLLYGILSYMKLHRQMANAVLLEKDVYQSDKIPSPFILGIIRPKIYLPFGLDEEMQTYVLMHEKYHIKKLDYLVKPFAFLLLALHWFNPLCWLAFTCMGRDMEMRCDEKVLSGKGNIKKQYSTALLSFAANRRFPAPSPLSFSESGVKGRIKNVLSWKQPKLWLSILVALLCTMLLIACAANPKTSNVTENMMSELGSYTAGRTIAENAALSVLMDNGSYYADIQATKNSLKITNDKGKILFKSVRTDEKSYTRNEFKQLCKETMLLLKSDYTLPSAYDHFTACTYYPSEDVPTESDAYYSIFWYQNEPVYFVEMMGGKMSILRIYEMLPNIKNLDAAVSSAILENNKERYLKGDFSGESHYTLYTRIGSLEDVNDKNYVTVFLQELYTEFSIIHNRLEDIASGSSPSAIVFKINPNGTYTPEQYWRPREGELLNQDLESVFPENAHTKYHDMDTNIPALQLQQACFAKAIEKSGIDANAAVKDLLNTVEETRISAATDSLSTADSSREYNLLLYYGDYTLEYIFKEFLKGGQTGTRGHLMWDLMDDICPYEQLSFNADNGQEYFDRWYAHAKEIYKQNDAEFMQENEPKSWLLLQMTDEG